MTLDNHDCENDRTTLGRILDLSWRLSDCAPPMKPFLRFSKDAEVLYKGKTDSYKQFFWDFDDGLQKTLLGMVRALATPAEIAEACIERWKTNLEQLCQGSRNRLRELQQEGGAPQFRYRPRDAFILSRVAPGSRLLYVGCGTGTECLGWAQRGYDVVGIDTDAELVAVANEWAQSLKLPFKAVCMDAHNIVFPPGSFDGFLLEFYGFQPSLLQALSLQKGLANVLHEDGKGFIVATRKKYASFWYRMSNYGYPESMFHWLKNQCQLDHCFSATDACEEKLTFGLYIRSHTVDSLSRELGRVFDVQECMYQEHDPRYLISVVKRKGCVARPPLVSEHCDLKDWAQPEYSRWETGTIAEVLCKIQAIAALLERHKNNVERFFLTRESSDEKGPLSMVDTELPRFIELLDRVYTMQAQH